MIYVALALIALPSIILAIAIYRAPEGIETPRGFHLINQPSGEGEPSGLLGIGGGADFLQFHNDGDTDDRQ